MIIPTSRSNTGMSCSVMASMKLSVYGTLSFANDVNRSLGWVVITMTRATMRDATIRPNSTKP